MIARPSRSMLTTSGPLRTHCVHSRFLVRCKPKGFHLVQGAKATIIGSGVEFGGKWQWNVPALALRALPKQSKSTVSFRPPLMQAYGRGHSPPWIPEATVHDNPSRFPHYGHPERWRVMSRIPSFGDARPSRPPLFRGRTNESDCRQVAIRNTRGQSIASLTRTGPDRSTQTNDES